MPRLETLHYDGEPVRLVFIEGRWWLNTEDAASLLSCGMSGCQLFEHAGETERRKAICMQPAIGPVISARYVIELSRESDKPNRFRLKAWLRAWKIVSASESRSPRH
jgi:prophage antirepressor-like protein